MIIDQSNKSIILAFQSEAIGMSIYEGERWTEYSRVLQPYASISRSYCFTPNSFSAGGFGTVNHNMFSNVSRKLSTILGHILDVNFR